MAARRHLAEIVVERQRAVHFGPRQVQRLGDEGDSGRVDIAEGRLERMQDGQRRAVELCMRGDDLSGPGAIPPFDGRHAQSDIKITSISAERKLNDKSIKQLRFAIEHFYRWELAWRAGAIRRATATR